MKKYKVEITKTFCIDVLADDTEEAKRLAETELERLEASDQQHYKQTGDTEFNVYDVTNTDDPFNSFEVYNVCCPVCDKPFINGTCKKCDDLVNNL